MKARTVVGGGGGEKKSVCFVTPDLSCDYYGGRVRQKCEDNKCDGKKKHLFPLEELHKKKFSRLKADEKRPWLIGTKLKILLVSFAIRQCAAFANRKK